MQFGVGVHANLRRTARARTTRRLRGRNTPTAARRCGPAPRSSRAPHPRRPTSRSRCARARSWSTSRPSAAAQRAWAAATGALADCTMCRPPLPPRNTATPAPAGGRPRRDAEHRILAQPDAQPLQQQLAVALFHAFVGTGRRSPPPAAGCSSRLSAMVCTAAGRRRIGERLAQQQLHPRQRTRGLHEAEFHHGSGRCPRDSRRARIPARRPGAGSGSPPVPAAGGAQRTAVPSASCTSRRQFQAALEAGRRHEEFARLGQPAQRTLHFVQQTSPKAARQPCARQAQAVAQRCARLSSPALRWSLQAGLASAPAAHRRSSPDAVVRG